MKEKDSEITIQVKEAQEILEVFSLLDEKTKELALATLIGMRLVSEVDRNKRKEKTA